MTAIVRTLPGMVDEAHRATAAIPVLQVIDHNQDDYDVRIDVSGHVDLIALAKAIYNNADAMYEWRIAMLNGNLARQVMAAAELRRIPAIRAALTISIDPAEAGLAADSLAERLEQAALEPARCQYWIACNRFTVGEEDYCEEHLADVAEHGPFEDRGFYDYGDDAS